MASSAKAEKWHRSFWQNHLFFRLGPDGVSPACIRPLHQFINKEMTIDMFKRKNILKIRLTSEIQRNRLGGKTISLLPSAYDYYLLARIVKDTLLFSHSLSDGTCVEGYWKTDPDPETLPFHRLIIRQNENKIVLDCNNILELLGAIACLYRYGLHRDGIAVFPDFGSAVLILPLHPEHKQIKKVKI